MAPTLISLVRVRTSLEREHARGGPSHHDQEVGDVGPQRDAGQEREPEGDHQREVRVVGDRDDHGGDRDRDQLGVPGLHAQQRGRRPSARMTSPQIMAIRPGSRTNRLSCRQT